MAGFGPAIHVFLFQRTKDVDTRVKPAHDVKEREEGVYLAAFRNGAMP